MKILYVANHDQTDGNDDEGAITHALVALGHDVQRVQEKNGHKSSRVGPVDLLLFHKWADWASIGTVDAKVKAFWYFDLVDHPDPSLAKRCLTRRTWMEQAIPLVDVGFCTDGDWVASHGGDGGGKYVLLRQGADERVTGLGETGSCEHCGKESRPTDILFAGAVDKCGSGRVSFHRWLLERWPGRVKWIERGIYREAMRSEVARTKVVVCPDSPVTDHYWSNRLYVMAGFGATLLHPDVPEHLPGVIFYKDRNEMANMVDVILRNPAVRSRQSRLDQISWVPTYRDRCRRLITKVETLL